MRGGAQEREATAYAGLSRTADGRPVPLAWVRAGGLRRLTDRLPGSRRGRLAGWVSAIAVALLALFLRVWQLGRPDRFAFDETYYAKDAWSLLRFGYVRRYVEDANDQILAGTTTGLWTETPSMVVHPEVGKWLIALGEYAAGMDPFGWRLPSAVAGAVTVLVMCRLARRLTGSTLLGAVAGLLLALDGLHLTLSRLALLDVFLGMFLLAGVACLVADRDWHRRRLADRIGPPASPGPPGPTPFGPVRGLVLRPWLLLGGVSFGLAVGTKWTALFPLAAFGLLVWVWSAGARRSFGVRAPVLKAALVDGVPAFVQLVGVAFIVYVATWTGWLVNAEAYEQALSDTQYTRYAGGDAWPTASEPDAEGLGEVAQSLRSLARYHRDVYVFHAYFLDDSDHSYQSRAPGWLLLSRPVSTAVDSDIQPGEQGCGAPEGSDCLRQVLMLGNPVIWWGGTLALLYAVPAWLGRRDWRFGMCLVGALSLWLPWFRYDDRPVFLFYALPVLLFMVLALALAMGWLAGEDRRDPAARGDPDSGPLRSPAGVVVAGSFVVLAVVAFAFFWPIWTHELLTHREWQMRMWFRRWI